jgi:hypothetical protein
MDERGAGELKVKKSSPADWGKKCVSQEVEFHEWSMQGQESTMMRDHVLLTTRQMGVRMRDQVRLTGGQDDKKARGLIWPK